MSEFRLTGDFYVSEWNGDDANAGTDPNFPKQTASDLPESTTQFSVIGSGYYFGFNKRIRLFGDGKIVIDFGGTQSTPRFNFTTTEALPAFRNIEFKNLDILEDAAINGGRLFVIDCIVDCKRINTIANTNGNTHLIKSILYRNDGQAITSLNQNKCTILLSNSILLNDWEGNSSINQGNTVQNGTFNLSYLPKGKRFFFNQSVSLIASYTNLQIRQVFGDSMINGTIEFVDGVYELKFLADGSPRPDSDPNIPDIATIGANWASIYTNGGCFAGDPKFIDLFNKIVAPDSDLLKRSGVNGFIGGVKPGRYIPVNSSDPNVVITSSQINTSDPTNWTIGAGFDEGFVDVIFKINDNVVEVPQINIDALLAFDSSQAGGSAGNNNVPDFFPTLYTPLSQVGLKPNHRTYGLRTSRNLSRPTSEAQWDNDNLALGSDVARFYVQRFDRKPKITDVLGVTYGEGNPQSIGGSANTINARWAHVRLRFTNRREQ